MVYVKRRASRIKSKRSGSKGYKRSRTKRSMTKSRRRVKRTQMKGKFKKLLFLKGGAGINTYTNLANSSPILDLNISSIDNIKTILEFIYDIKNIGSVDGYTHYKNLYCKIGINKRFCKSSDPNEIYNTIYTNVYNNYNYLFETKLDDELQNYINNKGDYNHVGKTEQNHKNPEYKKLFDIGIWYILTRFIKPLLQLELLSFLTNNISRLNELLTPKILDTPRGLSYGKKWTYGEILRNIKLEDIVTFCGDFMPRNKIITSLRNILTKHLNLFDYLQDFKTKNMNFYDYLQDFKKEACEHYQKQLTAIDAYDPTPGYNTVDDDLDFTNSAKEKEQRQAQAELDTNLMNMCE